MSIEIKNLDQLRARYGRWHFLQVLEPAVRRGAMRNQASIAEYPPAPRNSSYVRTGTLGRRWTTKTYNTGDALYGVTGNNTHYAQSVQSSEHQRDVFRRIGWQTDADVLEDNSGEIERDIQQAVMEALKK